MNKRLIMLMAAALALLSASSGEVRFTVSGPYSPIEVEPDHGTTGLKMIYVVYDINDVLEMTYTATSDAAVTWYTYDRRAADYRPVNGVSYNGRTSTLSRVEANKGYFIKEGGIESYYWIVNYADYYLELNDMAVVEDDPCEQLSFNIDGRGVAIPYYTVIGQRRVLDRKINLHYETLEFMGDTIQGFQWEPVPVDTTFASLEQRIEIAPPLCSTIFELSGDQFLKTWGLDLAYAPTSTYTTKAVDCRSTAEKESRDNPNENDNKNSLGGSAPINILFKGYPTEAVDYQVWEMATDQDFQNVIQRDFAQEVTYTFEEFGTYFVRYTVTNLESQCNCYGEVYTISVSESELKCPNAFSPGSSQYGVWRVTYKSLIEFHCWIFNRWGNLVYEYTDPGGGWDGTYRGQPVDTGVYYYVISAKGGDGKVWDNEKESRGAITILRYKGSSGTASDMEGGVGY